jgi:hypothetical protein
VVDPDPATASDRRLRVQLGPTAPGLSMPTAPSRANRLARSMGPGVAQCGTVGLQLRQLRTGRHPGCVLHRSHLCRIGAVFADRPQRPEQNRRIGVPGPRLDSASASARTTIHSWIQAPIACQVSSSDPNRDCANDPWPRSGSAARGALVSRVRWATPARNIASTCSASSTARSGALRVQRDPGLRFPPDHQGRLNRPAMMAGDRSWCTRISTWVPIQRDRDSNSARTRIGHTRAG